MEDDQTTSSLDTSNSFGWIAWEVPPRLSAPVASAKSRRAQLPSKMAQGIDSLENAGCSVHPLDDILRGTGYDNLSCEPWDHL